MSEESLRWFKAKRTNGNCSKPDRDAGLSQSCINGAVMSRQMSKSAERRLAKIKNQGLYEGCTVQMSNTGKLREIKSITHDGRILMKGAERVCSPSDCTLVK